MIAGASLAVFSFGTGTGLGLSVLQEGISDLITCVKAGIINRNFSWKQWGMQKAISSAVTIACAGFSALKAAARTVKSGLKTAKAAVKYGMQELWTKAAQEGLKIGGKKVAVEVVKRAAVEVTLSLINYALAETIVPIVENLIQTALADLIVLRYKHNADLQRLMDCDRKKRNRFFADKLKQKVLRHLHEEPFRELCQTAGRILLNKTSSNIGQAAAQMASVQLTLVPIIKKLGSIAISFDTEMNKLAESKEVQSILNAANESNGDTTGDRQAENKELPLTVEEFCSGITKQMSKIICQWIQGMLVPPLVASTVNNIFSGIDEKVNDELNSFHHKQTVAYFQSLTEEEIKVKVNAETRALAEQEIDAVRNGAPGRIHHIGFICQMKNRRVRIYGKDGRVEHVIGSDTSQDAIDIVYHPPSESNSLGHWTIKNGENTQNTGEFNCLFDTIGQSLGCTGEQLRQDTAAAMKANQDRLAATMHDVRYLEQNCSEALFTGGLQQKKYRRQQMAVDALKLSFKQKHLITEKSKHGGVTKKDLEEKTAKVLDKELGKVELGMTENTRSTNTVLLMTPEEFDTAISQARANNQFTPGKTGEIKVKLTNVEIMHLEWVMT
ncbi:unnamed protein product [Didymodactylos carnosus]|uniref:Uncharacterized protein n=1 Tax=Didymodactylos carnosus TaxID=1234261 RepID=A0A814KWZ5_9BILA|nr:unnamed protein product [Didymodactylos carnosus]CAF3826729.1 unnamed protein product [Didymodactylos carnosus]